MSINEVLDTRSAERITVLKDEMNAIFDGALSRAIAPVPLTLAANGLTLSITPATPAPGELIGDTPAPAPKPQPKAPAEAKGANTDKSALKDGIDVPAGSQFYRNRSDKTLELKLLITPAKGANSPVTIKKGKGLSTDEDVDKIPVGECVVVAVTLEPGEVLTALSAMVYKEV